MVRATKDFNKISGVTVTGKAYQLARKRKPSGRLNVQDIENAKKSLKLYNNKRRGAPGLIKGFAQDARNAILGGKKSKYTPNTRRGPKKAMGPVGGVPVNKKGTKIMKRRGGGIVKRGMGMAK